MASEIRFNEREFDNLLDKVFITDKQVLEVTYKGASEMLEKIKEGTPVDEGNVLAGWVKHQSRGRGYVISNKYEDENGDRIPFILEHKEGKSQGYWSRTVEENMDDIEEMMIKELEKNINL